MQLRDRFIKDMRLAGYSARAQEAYVHAVAGLVRYVDRPPMPITEEDARHRFLAPHAAFIGRSSRGN